jgi:hypothetical protein
MAEALRALPEEAEDYNEMNITMKQVWEAHHRRHGQPAYVKVDNELHEFLISVLERMAARKDAANFFETLHTLLEVGIEAGLAAREFPVDNAGITQAKWK